MLPMLWKEVADDHRLSPFFSLVEDAAACCLPPLDIDETDERYEVRLDVPGVAREDLAVRFENGTLIVSGQRSRPGKSSKRAERWSGKFERSFSLPDDADASRIEAKLEAGVLTIALPKLEKAKPRQIEIKS